MFFQSVIRSRNFLKPYRKNIDTRHIRYGPIAALGPHRQELVPIFSQYDPRDMHVWVKEYGFTPGRKLFYNAPHSAKFDQSIDKETLLTIAIKK